MPIRGCTIRRLRANLTSSSGNPVHCVHISRDGLVYVCDRVNDRIQVFSKAGKFVKEFTLRPQTLGMGSTFQFVFSLDAQQKYLLVADGENNTIWTLRGRMARWWGRWGTAGAMPGNFTGCTRSFPIRMGICTPEKWIRGSGFRNLFRSRKPPARIRLPTSSTASTALDNG